MVFSLSADVKMRSFSLFFLSVCALIGLTLAMGYYYAPYYVPVYPQTAGAGSEAFIASKCKSDVEPISCSHTLQSGRLPVAKVLLLVHYENTPIQIYRKFHLQKLNFFR